MLHAVVLYSVGSPQKANTECLKSYLKQFLSDKLVVKLPRFLWQPILRSFILRTRPERMISRYQQIFVDNHNPYLTSMHKMAFGLECYLNSSSDEVFKACLDKASKLAVDTDAVDSVDTTSCSIPQNEPNAASSSAKSSDTEQDRYMVKFAFAYCGKGLEQVVTESIEAGAKKVTVIPLFPQYSDTTTKRPTMVMEQLKAKFSDVDFAFVRSYGSDEKYIETITNLIHPALNELVFSVKHKCKDEDMNCIMKQGKAHVLITYHSLPQSYIKLGDPYLTEVDATTDLLINSLGIERNNISIAFQSKMGPMPWLKPDIEDEVKRLLDSGVTRLLVIAPGFSVDCLETLYDLNIKLRERFLNLGGESFLYVPALNHSKSHIQLLAHLVRNAAKPV